MDKLYLSPLSSPYVRALQDLIKFSGKLLQAKRGSLNRGAATSFVLPSPGKPYGVG